MRVPQDWVGRRVSLPARCPVRNSVVVTAFCGKPRFKKSSAVQDTGDRPVTDVIPVRFVPPARRPLTWKSEEPVSDQG